MLVPGPPPSHPPARAKPRPLPRARGMVVVTGREPDSRRPDGAMSSSDAEDDFLEPATPTATQAGHALPLLPQEVPGPGRGWGRGKGRRTRSQCPAELTLGCEQRGGAGWGSGRGRRQSSLLPYPPRSHHPPIPPTPCQTHQVCLPCPRRHLALPSSSFQDSLPPGLVLPSLCPTLIYWRREGRPWEGTLGAPRDDSVF